MTDQTQQDNNQPQAAINAQYIKDLSFENPHAPSVYLKQGAQPNIRVDVAVKANKVQDGMYEVVLNVTANAKTDDATLFILELAYAGLITVQNFPEDHLQPYLLIEVPRMLFPFARNIISDCTRDSGFPPLMLNNIDFVALYQSSLQAEQAKGKSEVVN